MWELIEGDCIERMRELDEASVDAIVTDPPYGIGFMGHEWDQPGDFGPVRANGEPGLDERVEPARRRQRQPSPATGAGHARERAMLGGPSGRDNRTHTLRGGAMHAGRYDQSRSANQRFQAWCESWAREAFRVLKPGGHLLVFGSTRTYHRLSCGVEDAGFEIRDTLAWLYGSGFPKSKNIGGGWGTALKPAFEPIVLARKPLSERNVAANVLEHGTGAINVDGTRIEPPEGSVVRMAHSETGSRRGYDGGLRGGNRIEPQTLGRWPANVVLDEEAAAMLDEQSGERAFMGLTRLRLASRFFYTAKTSRAERERGVVEYLPDKDEAALNWSSGEQSPGTFQAEGTNRKARNHHPTVKPVDLMQWLCRLVTPPGGLVLDPFTGSGSTGIAALREGFSFLGIEREPEYVEIARARILGDAPLLNAGAES
jgi:DNA modification methylase